MSSNRKCDKCLNLSRKEQMFCDPYGDKYYCAKCLTNLYLFEYQKVIKSHLDKRKIQIRLFSGRNYPYIDFQQFFKDFCIRCGRPYRKDEDFQLINSGRLCKACTNSQMNHFEGFMLKCAQCQQILRSNDQIKSDLGDNTFICNQCGRSQIFLQSKFQEEKAKTANQFFKQLRQSDAQNKKQQPHHLLRMISKYSVEQNFDNTKLKINISHKKITKCSQCGAHVQSQNAFPVNKKTANKIKRKDSRIRGVMINNYLNEQQQPNTKSEGLMVCKCCYVLGVDVSEIGFTNELVLDKSSRSRFSSLKKSNNNESHHRAYQLEVPSYLPSSKSDNGQPQAHQPIRIISIHNINPNKCTICQINDPSINTIAKGRICGQCYSKLKQ